MTKNDLDVVIFSFNRPLQLEALLSSFIRHCKSSGWVYGEDSPMKISVLYKFDPEYSKAYSDLVASFWNVDFVQEKNFKEDLLFCVGSRKFTMFLCDDAVFVKDFDLEEIIGIMSNERDIYNAGLIGFSFRMGENTKMCYPANKEQKLPDFIEKDDKYVLWDWSTAELDFAYPLELSASLYSTKIILPLLQHTQYTGPNFLEWNMFLNLEKYKGFLPYLMSYKTSVSFCNPCNRVQSTNENRCGSDENYSQKSLLKKYEDGLWIDVEDLDNIVSDGAHMIYPFKFKKETLDE